MGYLEDALGALSPPSPPLAPTGPALAPVVPPPMPDTADSPLGRYRAYLGLSVAPSAPVAAPEPGVRPAAGQSALERYRALTGAASLPAPVFGVGAVQAAESPPHPRPVAQAPAAPPPAAPSPLPAPTADPLAIRPDETDDAYVRRLRARGMGDVEAGLRGGIESTKALGYGALAAGADALGLEGPKAWALEGYRAAEEAGKPYQEGRAASIEDIKPSESGAVDRAVDWAQYQLGSLLPSIAETVVAGAIGAVAGSQVPGAGTAVGAVAGATGKGLAKDWIRKRLGEYVVKEVGEDAVQAGVKTAAQQAALAAAGQSAQRKVARDIGARLGVFAASYQMGLGDVYGETLNAEKTDGNAGTAFLAALPYAALDSLTEIGILGRLGKGEGSDSLVKLAGNLLKESAGTAAQEGFTEAAQEAVLLAAGMTEGKEYSSDEVLSRLGNAAAAGAVGGGAMGGASGAWRATRQPADTLETLLARAPEPLRRPGTGTPQDDRERAAAAAAHVQAVRKTDPAAADALFDRYADLIAGGAPAPTGETRQQGGKGGTDNLGQGQEEARIGARAEVDRGRNPESAAPGGPRGTTAPVDTGRGGAPQDDRPGVPRALGLPGAAPLADLERAARGAAERTTGAGDSGGGPDAPRESGRGGAAVDAEQWGLEPIHSEPVAGRTGTGTREVYRSADGASVLERLSGPDGAVVRERTRPVAEFAAEHAQAVDARRTALESRMLAWEVENPGQPWPNTLHEQLAETAVERARWARLADRIGADKAASGPLVPADRAATAEVEALRASDARAYLRALTTGKGGRALKASPELAHLRQRIAQGEEIRTTEDVRRVLDAFRAAPAAAQPTSNPDESVQAAPVPADRARPGVDVPQPRSAAPVLGALEPGADDLGRTDGQTSSGGAPRAQAPNEVTTDAGRGRETPVAEAADRQRAEDAGGRDTAERLGATAAASGRGVGSALGSAESERVRGSTAPSAGPAGESVAGFAAGTSGARARGEAGQAPPSPDPGADYAAFDALSVQVPMPGNDAGDAGARVYQAGPELRALDRRITDLRRVLACVSGAR